MEAVFNHQMLILARESRGISQGQLADAIDMSATNLCKIERADIGIAQDKLERIAEITNYPLQFFYRPGDVVPENHIYRRRVVVAQKLLTPVHAQANIIRLQVQQLEPLLQLPSWQWPTPPSEALTSPVALASWLRDYWQVPQGPIAHLVRLLEHQGIVLATFNFGTPRIDSRSITTQQQRPIIIINSSLPGCRQRFSIAYELGLLLLQHYGMASPTDDIGHEANIFAAALLLPEADIKPAFTNGVNIALLTQLKPLWKTSMIALLYRADDLGFLTYNQKRYLVQQFNILNIRRTEPPELVIPFEQPTLIKQWLALCKETLHLTTVELAALLCLELPEYLELYS